jgi:hypothetical protein
LCLVAVALAEVVSEVDAADLGAAADQREAIRRRLYGNAGDT